MREKSGGFYIPECVKKGQSVIFLHTLIYKGGCVFS